MTVTDVAGALATHPGWTLALLGVLFAGVVALFDLWGLRKFLAWPWRLVTGGIIVRPTGKWDSRWTTAAPEHPADRPAFRGEWYPRTRWGRMPGYQRMVLRWVAFAALYLLWRFTLPMLCVLVIVAIVVVGRQVLRVSENWCRNQVASGVVPAIEGPLGYRNTDPAEWLALPRPRLVWVPIALPARVTRAVRRWESLEHLLGRLGLPTLRTPLHDDNARVIVSLPVELADDTAVKEIKRRLTSRLPEGPWKAEHTDQALEIVLTHPKRPPAECWYDADAYKRFTVDNIPIAQKAGGEWFSLPVKELTPHGIISATTGWCKTTTANVIVAHTAGHGAHVFINDPKRVGYVRAFGDMDNITIRTTVDGWLATIDEFLAEMERRYSLIEEFPEIKDNPELYFQPWFLLNDERGSYVQEIRDRWKADGGKGTPEALRKEKRILWQSRAAAMYVADAAQQAGLDVFVDSDGRDQRMWRIASGPQTRSSWLMLFPGVTRIRAAIKKGRAVIGLGVDKVEEVQLALIDDATAREFAALGIEIGVREAFEREERIRALREGSVPAGDSAPVAGETAAGVPGQRGDGDATENGAPAAGKGNLHVIHGDGGNGPRDDESDSDDRGGDNSEDSDGDADDDLIVGLKAAAEFLSDRFGTPISEETFKKARQRANESGGIRGETRRGDRPAWPRLALTEWHSQRPRAGAR
ncbi:hypothetical protein [Cryptosporangium aurantiacum]|uniref:FtsK/SpoIIIE family protein n=1 Tax=Cryptosporangium aurantiacum TaxID=134849 RepID=A0A1M7RPH1_9ACTN|nr:hypothetical protein [Cryptosporangium aurantiacum]SHN48185.1 hypothetical protein SAMN05443668_1363 [Cryptosporangium aurantiacum]